MGSALDTESATDHPGGGGGGRGVFTTILSDMAPSTTGNRTTDAARSYDLAEHAVRLALGDAALDILDSSSDRDAEDADSRVALDSAAADATPAGLLRAGGSLVVKLLEGPGAVARTSRRRANPTSTPCVGSVPRRRGGNPRRCSSSRAGEEPHRSAPRLG